MHNGASGTATITSAEITCERHMAVLATVTFLAGIDRAAAAVAALATEHHIRTRTYHVPTGHVFDECEYCDDEYPLTGTVCLWWTIPGATHEGAAITCHHCAHRAVLNALDDVLDPHDVLAETPDPSRDYIHAARALLTPAPLAAAVA